MAEPFLKSERTATLTSILGFTLLRILFLAVMLGLSCTYESGVIHADPPGTIDAFGMWTLNRLGYSDVTFSAQKNPEIFSVKYTLPSAAQQGPDGWYIIHLHFRIEFDEGEGGLAYVSAMTDGHAADQVQFEVTRQNNELSIRWGTVDLLGGATEQTTSATSIEASEANYVQYAGVQPGENILSFQLERYGSVKVKSLRIFDDSGIEYSPAAPAKVHLQVHLGNPKVRVGETFEVPFSLSNSGGRLATNVAVDAEVPHGALQVVSASGERIPSLSEGRKEVKAGRFIFRALKAGHHRILLRGTSSANRQEALIEVQVDRRSASGHRQVVVMLAALAGAGVAGLLSTILGRRLLARLL